MLKENVTLQNTIKIAIIHLKWNIMSGVPIASLSIIRARRLFLNEYDFPFGSMHIISVEVIGMESVNAYINFQNRT